jgi:tetratricopeptide (TPR) repeat protein
VGELAFLMCRAEMLNAGPEEAQRLHALAAAQLGDDAKPALAVQRDHLDGVERAAAEATTPRSAYLLASQYTARGQYRAALPLLEGVVLRSPKSVGAWFLKARCHHALGQPAEAVACYGTCIVLRPTFAQAYQARAGVNYSVRRDLKQALADLDEALRLEPDCLEARVDRALVLHALKRDRDALPDLDLALRRPLCPSRVYFIRSEVRRRLGDKGGSAADRARGLKEEPADAASWVTRGVAVLRDDADAALRDFQRAERLNPRMIEALIDQAFVLGEVQKRHDEALAVLDRFIRLHPDHVNGRSGRAVLLARMGRGHDAVAEAERCLKLSSTAETQYRAACIYALASEGKPERLKEAKKLLASALTAGWGHQYVRTDGDLDALRRDPTFESVLDSVKRLEEWKSAR